VVFLGQHLLKKVEVFEQKLNITILVRFYTLLETFGAREIKSVKIHVQNMEMELQDE
jgi:hypothetical protein